jgi:hypothetical protein
MHSIIYRGMAIGLGIVGIGLILSAMTISGIVALTSGVGLWMADFQLQPVDDRVSRRLVAKGSPALLLLPLMLAAGKVYMVITDSLFAQGLVEEQCALDSCPGPVRLMLRML